MTAATAVLRQSCGQRWDGLIDNPFVARMADGTLPLENFRFYIEQNLHYLPQYARMLGFALANAQNNLYLERFQRAIKQIVEVEVPANQRLLADVIKLGASSLGGETPGAPCIDYGNFLVATAATGNSNDVIVAMLPCAWSYGDLGSRYSETTAHDVYQDWVAVWSGADYQRYIGRLVEEANSLIGQPTQAEMQRYEHLFATSVRMEHAFWIAAHKAGEPPAMC